MWEERNGWEEKENEKGERGRWERQRREHSRKKKLSNTDIGRQKHTIKGNEEISDKTKQNI